MRHKKHRHSLGVKKEHRKAIMASLSSALFEHGKIRTTLAKANALRPFSEKIITLAKKAYNLDDAAKKLHYRRQAISKVRNVAVVHSLFDKHAERFQDRQGGYLRITKLLQRRGDAAHMAVVEMIDVQNAKENDSALTEQDSSSETPKEAEEKVEDTEKSIDSQ